MLTVYVFKNYSLQYCSAMYGPRTFAHFHRVISYLNMWITALSENPWVYFSLSVKVDLFLHVPEPQGRLPLLTAPNVQYLHNGLSAVLCTQSVDNFRPTFPANISRGKTDEPFFMRLTLHAAEFIIEKCSAFK